LFRFRYAPPRGYGYRRFRRGARLGAPFYASTYWLRDPSRYRLPPHGGHYRWVRYFGDVALVDTRTGAIVDIEYGFFL
jgi:Ni/Co efflux regulator RcnB